MAWSLREPITTERLRLRTVTAADAGAVLEYRSLPEVARYVPFEPMDAAAVAERIAGRWSQITLDEDNTSLLLGIARAADDLVIGDLTLMMGEPEHRGAELGWVLHPAHSGHGYATEAARALIGLCFGALALRRVTARVDTRNAASLRLADRLGMRREAHLRQNEWFKGGWSDEIDFALLRDEWAARRPGTQAGSGPASGQGEGASTIGGRPA